MSNEKWEHDKREPFTEINIDSENDNAGLARNFGPIVFGTINI